MNKRKQGQESDPPKAQTAKGARASKPRTLAAPANDSMPLLGAHVSTSGGVNMAVERALSIGCTAMQIFVKSNMQWFAPSALSPDDCSQFREGCRKLRAAFGHAGYMINLAATNPDFLEKSRRALREELMRADQLGLPFLVLHPGAHMGAGEEAGLARVVESLDLVFADIPKVKTKVALENTAGQGTSLGAPFEHLRFILKAVRQPKRLCVCLDTAHLFAAGYDLSTREKAAAVMRTFHRVVGLKHLAALHLNDSKTALGSHVDRHEHIGEGRIGMDGFRYFMTAPELAGIPKVLETPKEKEMKEDVENMKRLRSLCAGVQRSGSGSVRQKA